MCKRHNLFLSLEKVPVTIFHRNIFIFILFHFSLEAKAEYSSEDSNSWHLIPNSDFGENLSGQWTSKAKYQIAFIFLRVLQRDRESNDVGSDYLWFGSLQIVQTLLLRRRHFGSWRIWSLFCSFLRRRKVSFFLFFFFSGLFPF